MAQFWPQPTLQGTHVSITQTASTSAGSSAFQEQQKMGKGEVLRTFKERPPWVWDQENTLHSFLHAVESSHISRISPNAIFSPPLSTCECSRGPDAQDLSTCTREGGQAACPRASSPTLPGHTHRVRTGLQAAHPLTLPIAWPPRGQAGFAGWMDEYFEILAMVKHSLWGDGFKWSPN